MTISLRTRKILMISGFIILTGAIAFAMYMMFWRNIIAPEKEDTIFNENTNKIINKTNLPSANTTGEVIENVNQISNANKNEIVYPIDNANANVNQAASLLPEDVSEIANGNKTLADTIDYVDTTSVSNFFSDGRGFGGFDETTGKVYKINLDSEEKTEITSANFKGAEKVVWSKDLNAAVFMYPDGYNVLYDLRQDKTYILPKGGKDFSFSPQGNKLAYKTNSKHGDDNWIAIVNADGTNVKRIEPYGEKDADVKIDWAPDGETLAMYRKTTGYAEQTIYFFNESGDNLKSITALGRGVDSIWSSTGKTIAYSVHSESTNLNPTLWLDTVEGDLTGTGRSSTGLATWANKCAFSANDDYLYCGVPESLPQGSGLFKDEIGTDHIDQIYRIDVKTGYKTLLAIPTDAYGHSNFQVESMFVAEDNSALYFIDKFTQSLKEIKLK